MQILYGPDIYYLMIIIKENLLLKILLTLNFLIYFIWIFAPIIIFILLRLFFKINKSNIVTWMFNYIIWKSKKEKKF